MNLLFNLSLSSSPYLPMSALCLWFGVGWDEASFSATQGQQSITPRPAAAAAAAARRDVFSRAEKKAVGKYSVHSSVHPTSKRKIKALLYYVVKAELMPGEAPATAKIGVCLLKSGRSSDQCHAAAITGQFVSALFTSQRSVRCPGGVLLMSQLAHVCTF